MQSVQADPMLSGGGNPVTGIPGMSGSSTTNGSEVSVQTSNDNTNLWLKNEYNKQSRVPVSGADPSSGGSNSGNRELKAGPTPPKTSAVSSFVPPHPIMFQQPEEMVTTTNGTGDSPSITGDGLPITETQFKAAMAVTMEQARQMDSSPADKIPGMLASAETLKQVGSSWIGESAQLAFGAGLGSIAGGAGGAGGGASGGDGGELDSLLNALVSFPSPGLINVANEASGTPAIPLIPFKTIPQAVWMVQQMYKHFSVPLAILLLLPGAVITQLKSQIAANFNLKTEDATSPFEGILRAMIAVFLIPATQLIVSYSIDVGNSLAYSVNPAVGVLPIIGWLQQVAYSTSPSNSQNAMLPAQGGGVQAESGDGGGVGGGLGNPFSMLQGGSLSGALGALGGGGGFGGGLAAGESDDQSVPEQQSDISSTLQTMFNVMIYIFSIGMLVMTAFQLAIMCYLFLLGPVAAAFFAWPTVKGKIFRPVFGNWVNAVITVSLWRFYWMVILAIMTNRLLNLGENGSMLFNLQWEVAIFTCLIGLLFYVPMNPWSFDPGQAYRISKMYGESIMQAASKGAGGGGGKEGGGKEGGGKNGGGDKEEGGGKDGGKDNNAQKSSSPSLASAGSGNASGSSNSSGSGSNGSGMPAILASTSGSPADSSQSSNASQAKSMPTDSQGGKSEAPPLGDATRSLASGNNGSSPHQSNDGQGSNSSGQSQTSGSNSSEPPLAQLASTSTNGGSSNGETANASAMPYSLLPTSGGQGSSSNPSVASNANASPADIQSGLQQNYGDLLSNSGNGNQLPPATSNSMNSTSVAQSTLSPNAPQGGLKDNQDIDKPPTGGSIA